MARRQSPPFMSSRRRRGTVMVLVIWIILVLTVVAYSLAYEMRIGLKMSGQGKKRLRAQALARAGLAHAVMDLRNDRLLAYADSGRNSDTLDDVWANAKDKIDVKYGGGTYSVVTVDEESKLNINVLQPNSVGVLQYMLEEVGKLKRNLAETTTNAVIDYKDPDFYPLGAEGGHEVDYYTEWGSRTLRSAMPEGWRFRPKNDNFLTLSELLDVPGLTPEVLNGKADQDAPDIFEQALSKSKMKDGSKALVDYLTVSSTGQININTCPVRLLEAILVGGTRDKTAAKYADKIDRARQNALRKRTNEGYGINNLGQLVQEGVPAEVVSMLERVVTMSTNSSNFTITSRGEFGGVRATIQALVWVAPEPYSLDQMDKRDRKRDPRAAAVINKQLNLIVDPSVRVNNISEY